MNEVLLIDENGNVEEGMSSNFFAVHKGTVYTAEEGVLKGTVRELVLEVRLELCDAKIYLSILYLE